MHYQLLNRDQTRKKLWSTRRNWTAANFVVDELMGGPDPFLPAVRTEGARRRFFFCTASEAVIEIEIAERMVSRWSLIHPDNSKGQEMASARLWSRLEALRRKARRMVRDYDALEGREMPEALPPGTRPLT